MSSSVTSSSYESKSGADILSNLTGIIQEKFPKINVGDIPGLDDNSNESRTNFAVFMCSLIFGMFWITYITFFNSRVVGSIVTRILNRFVQVGYVKVRSISNQFFIIWLIKIGIQTILGTFNGILKIRLLCTHLHFSQNNTFENCRTFLSLKKISSNQLLSNFFSKYLTFTKFLPKIE